MGMTPGQMSLPKLDVCAYRGGMTLRLVRAIEPQWQMPCGLSTSAAVSRISDFYGTEPKHNPGRWRT